MSTTRLTRLINSLRALVLSKCKDQEVVCDLLDSAETLDDVEYVMTESGEGKIPDDLLASSGFWECLPPSERKKRSKEKHRKPPRTGVVARGAYSKSSQRVAEMDRPDVRVARRKAAG